MSVSAPIKFTFNVTAIIKIIIIGFRLISHKFYYHFNVTSNVINLIIFLFKKKLAVPQRSVLKPVLFIIYINDLLNDAVRLNTVSTSYLLETHFFIVTIIKNVFRYTGFIKYKTNNSTQIKYCFLKVGRYPKVYQYHNIIRCIRLFN